MIQNEKRLAEAAGRVYRYMMHSKPEEWGGHKWADWAMNIDRWDWNPGVGLIAAEAYGEHEGEALRDVEAWMSRHLGKPVSPMVINTAAPFAVLPGLARETGQARYGAEAKAIAGWLMREAPRTRSGAYEHTVTEDASFREQIWADTVFMAVLCLARTARMTGDGRMAEEAIRQTLLHLQALQDDETGLLYHGWNGETKDWMSAAKWNRANAWNALAVPMILSEAETLSGESAAIDEIRSRYRRLAKGLAATQLPDGLWPTVLDRPGYYAETSGSAGIACGLLKAAATGLLPASYAEHAERALPAVLERVGADGAVAGVSGGTPVLDTVEAYGEVPVFPTLYGQGLVLLLLTEALRKRV
ncbi:glycoside hydrolase family 105 protein [Cohnella sp. REN36]|uniref:glycoside hydrolase family 88/105 protein n=1 Tax=Cohnella sp. REN36 TaxID=2887347 RepID=UPI001D1532F6|nr:glycoside hydrolase family 88 protein [Cohnella sp. REN36]MCC3371901.1 glycoside hydrolase family 88 protein [Cohnella sp. REN36]